MMDARQPSLPPIDRNSFFRTWRAKSIEQLSRVPLRALPGDLMGDARARVRQRRIKKTTVASVGVVAMCLLGWSIYPVVDQESEQIVSASANIGVPLHAPADQTLQLSFDDESVMDLQRSAVAIVLQAEGRSAEVMLQEGAIDAKIVPTASTKYSIAAGPYLVRVTGTRFFVDWKSEGEAFRLELHRGAVDIVDSSGVVHHVQPGEKCSGQEGSLNCKGATRRVEEKAAPGSEEVKRDEGAVEQQVEVQADARGER